MGLFKKIKKGLSKVWKGIKKGFKKVMSKVGKFLNSKWGKILMIVASVFTLGTAMMAGYTAWTQATGSVLQKFVAAGGDFVRSLVGMQTKYGAKGSLKAGADAAKGAADAAAKTGEQLQGMQQAAEGAQAAVQGGDTVAAELAGATNNLNQPMDLAIDGGASSLAQGAKGGAEALGQGAAAGVQAGTPQAVTQMGQGGGVSGMGALEEIGAAGMDLANPVAQSVMGNTPQAAGGFWGGVAKAGGGLFKQAGKFIQSPSGQTMIGKTIEGLGQAMLEKEKLKDERRYDEKVARQWRNYDWSGINLGPESNIGRNPIRHYGDRRDNTAYPTRGKYRMADMAAGGGG